MRPIALSVRAFGPYVEEERIDFRELGGAGLFLIHGPTGAGKTAILDAVQFALYGETSGGDRDGAQMRSDLAGPEAPTEVSLEFAVGREVYRVQRSPAWERPRKRGGGTVREPARATRVAT